jgi:hypothetical protein
VTWKKERVPGLPSMDSTEWLRPIGRPPPEGTFEAELLMATLTSYAIAKLTS